MTDRPPPPSGSDLAPSAESDAGGAERATDSATSPRYGAEAPHYSFDDATIEGNLAADSHRHDPAATGERGDITAPSDQAQRMPDHAPFSAEEAAAVAEWDYDPGREPLSDEHLDWLDTMHEAGVDLASVDHDVDHDVDPDPPEQAADPPDGRVAARWHHVADSAPPPDPTPTETDLAPELDLSRSDAVGTDQDIEVGESDAEPAHDDAGAGEEGVGAFLEGALFGDFADEFTWSGLAGQTLSGFIPIYGQVADARDIAHSLGEVIDGKDGAWVGLGINVIGIVPGMDFLKGLGKAGKGAVKRADAVGMAVKRADVTSGPARHVDSAGGVDRALSEGAALQRGDLGSYRPIRDPAGRPDIRDSPKHSPTIPDASVQRISVEAARKSRHVIARKIGEHKGLREAWESARAKVLKTYPEGFPGSANEMNRKNGAFERTTKAFWRKVNRDPALKKFFKDHGFIIEKAGNAPVHESVREFRKVQDLPPKLEDEFRLTVDHMLPKAKGDNWKKALDPEHLQFVTQAENRFLQLLEKLGVTR